MQMKQPAWQAMPMLDVRTLSTKALRTLANEYDRLSVQALEPLAQLKTDHVRSEIDSVISRILKLPDFTFVRDLLDREPGLTAREIATRRVAAVAANGEGVEEDQSDLF
jgi:hypothetical protein